jgi:hypothetical protein
MEQQGGRQGQLQGRQPRLAVEHFRHLLEARRIQQRQAHPSEMNHQKQHQHQPGDRDQPGRGGGPLHANLRSCRQPRQPAIAEERLRRGVGMGSHRAAITETSQYNATPIFDGRPAAVGPG